MMEAYGLYLFVWCYKGNSVPPLPREIWHTESEWTVTSWERETVVRETSWLLVMSHQGES